MNIAFSLVSVSCYTPNYIKEYWNHPNIHNLGNGWKQALLSPVATKVIDIVSYNNEDVRNTIRYNFLSKDEKNVDLCCGTGFSTTENGVGVDTSNAMISVAKLVHPSKKFYIGNSESFGSDKEYDTSSIFFSLHEVPQNGRIRILENALRISKKRILICDISPKKKIPDLMLVGEPYIKEYQDNIHEDLNIFCLNNNLKLKLIEHIEDRLNIYVLDI